MILKDIVERRRPGVSFKLSKVIVVGPYPSAGFFEYLREDMRPASVVLFVDDGWPNGKLHEIEDCFYRKHCKFSYYRVAPKNRAGLVHAKIYLFEWVNEKQNQIKRRLLLGSANASEQGFRLHAETYINADLLSGAQTNAVSAYFQSLIENKSCKAIEVNFGEAVTAWLPELTLVDMETVGLFDAWLRRGFLCHKYEREQTFAKFRLTLKKAFPRANIENIFASVGFGRVGESNVYFRNYLPNELRVDDSADDMEDSSSKHQWKGQYLIETRLGHWVSEDCYTEYKDAFVTQNSDKARNIVDAVNSANDEQKKAWIDAYLGSVQNILNKIDTEGLVVEDYLHTNDGDIDIEYYKNQAIKKLQADYELTLDTIFEDRYICGYSFLSMPQMGDEFEDFAVSFCSSILSKGKRNSRNKLARLFAEKIFPQLSQDKTAESLLNWLRTDQNWSKVRDMVLEYYEH